LVAWAIVLAGVAKHPPELVIVDVLPVAEQPVLVCEHSVVNDLQDEDTELTQRTPQLETVLVIVHLSSLELDCEVEGCSVEGGFSVEVGFSFVLVESLVESGSSELPWPSSRAGGSVQLPTDIPNIFIQGRWNSGNPGSLKSTSSIPGRFQNTIPRPPGTMIRGTRVVWPASSVVVYHSFFVSVVPGRVVPVKSGGTEVTVPVIASDFLVVAPLDPVGGLVTPPVFPVEVELVARPLEEDPVELLLEVSGSTVVGSFVEVPAVDSIVEVIDDIWEELAVDVPLFEGIVFEISVEAPVELPLIEVDVVSLPDISMVEDDKAAVDSIAEVLGHIWEELPVDVPLFVGTVFEISVEAPVELSLIEVDVVSLPDIWMVEDDKAAVEVPVCVLINEPVIELPIVEVSVKLAVELTAELCAGKYEGSLITDTPLTAVGILQPTPPGPIS
jgi:hypothetical protein